MNSKMSWTEVHKNRNKRQTSILMNNSIMSSTTESSDWEHKLVSQSRRPSTNSQSSSRPRKKSRPTPQPILPRTNVPGQSVFSVSAPMQYVPPMPVKPIPFPHPYYQPPNPFPPVVLPPYANPVNSTSMSTPSYNLPVNPTITRVINEHVPSQHINHTPSTWDAHRQPQAPQVNTPPQCSTVPRMDTPHSMLHHPLDLSGESRVALAEAEAARLPK